MRYACVLLGGTRGRSVLDPETGQVDESDGEAQLVRPGFHERQSVHILEASKPQAPEVVRLTQCSRGAATLRFARHSACDLDFTSGSLFASLKHQSRRTLEICAIDAVLARCGDASIRATA